MNPMTFRSERWPREYVAEILALPTREERRAALNRVPSHLRPIVKTHVRIQWETRRVRSSNPA